MKKRETLVFYSYFDQHEGKYLTSNTGIVIEGIVTPRKVKGAAMNKWRQAGYKADIKSLRIEGEEVIY